MAYKSIFEEGEIKPATTPKASTGYVSIFDDEEKKLEPITTQSVPVKINPLVPEVKSTSVTDYLFKELSPKTTTTVSNRYVQDPTRSNVSIPFEQADPKTQYENLTYDEIKKMKSSELVDLRRKAGIDKGDSKEWYSSFMAGIGDIMTTVGSTMKWQGAEGGLIDRIGENIQEAGKITQSKYTDYEALDKLGEFDWADLKDVSFWQNKAPRMLPFTMSLIPAAIIGGSVGATAGASFGLGALVTTITGAIGGAVLNRPLEGMMEAGSTYDEAIAKGFSEEKAQEVANEVFVENLKQMSVLDVIQMIPLLKGIKGFKIPNSTVNKIVNITGTGTAIVSEGFEEVLQNRIVANALGEKFDLASPETKESFVLGTIMGGVFQGSGGIVNISQRAITNATKENLSKKNQAIFEKSLDKFMKEGETRSDSEVLALNEVAKIDQKGLQDAITKTLDEKSQELKDAGIEQQASTVLKEETPADKLAKQIKKSDPIDRLLATIEEQEVETKVEEPLVQEAKKYKSADEFIKAQGTPVYHGTSKEFTEFSNKNIGTGKGATTKGIWFTSNIKEAEAIAEGQAKLSSKLYGGIGKLEKARVIEAYSDIKNSKTIDVKGEVLLPDEANDIVINAEKNGNDSVIFKNVKVVDGINADHTVIIDPKNIKTKSQLTDIWNKAQEKPTAKEAPTIKKPTTKKKVKEVKSTEEEISKSVESIISLPRKEAIQKLQESIKENGFVKGGEEVLNKVATPTLNRGIDLEVFKRKPSILNLVKENVFTDSFILINDKEIAKKLYKEVKDKTGVEEDKGEPAIEWKQIVPEKWGNNEADIIGYENINEESWRNFELMVRLTDRETNAYVNANKLAFMKKQLPSAKMYLSGQNTPVVFIERGKVKGLLMPINISKDYTAKYQELSNEDALIQEAKKYKSADEFVDRGYKYKERIDNLIKYSQENKYASWEVPKYFGETFSFPENNPKIEDEIKRIVGEKGKDYFYIHSFYPEKLRGTGFVRDEFLTELKMMKSEYKNLFGENSHSRKYFATSSFTEEAEHFFDKLEIEGYLKRLTSTSKSYEGFNKMVLGKSEKRNNAELPDSWLNVFEITDKIDNFLPRMTRKDFFKNAIRGNVGVKEIYKKLGIKTKSQLTDIWNKANETKYQELGESTKLPDIQLKKDVITKDMQGNKITLKEGEAPQLKVEQKLYQTPSQGSQVLVETIQRITTQEALAQAQDFAIVRDTNIPIKAVETIIENPRAFGKYQKGTIEFIYNPDITTIPHEIGHYWFEAMLTKDQQTEVLREYKEWFIKNKPNKARPDTRNGWEEAMVQDMAKYYSKKYTKKKGKIERFWDWFIYQIKRVLNKNDFIARFTYDVRTKSIDRNVSKRKLADSLNQTGAIRTNGGIIIPDETKGQAFRRKIQDINTRIDTTVTTLRGSGIDIPESQDIFLAKTLLPRRIGGATEKFANEVMNPLINAMAKDGVDLDNLNLYLHAMHAPERNRKMNELRKAENDKRNRQRVNPKPYFSVDGLSGMTDAEARSVINTFKEMGIASKLEEHRISLQKISKATLLFQLKEGLLSQEEYDAISGSYENYVPLSRDIEDNAKGWGTGKGVNVKGKEIKRARGSQDLPVLPIVSQIFNRMNTAIIRAEKNRVALSVARLIKANPKIKTKTGKELWTIKSEKYIPRYDSFGEVEYAEPLGARSQKPNEIAFKYKGKQKYLVINDPLLVRALTDEGKSKPIPYLTRYTSLLSRLATQYNPEFLIRNFSRDISESLVNVSGIAENYLTKEDTKGLKSDILKSIPKLFGAIYGYKSRKESHDAKDLIDEFIKNGGEVGYFWLEDEKTLDQKFKRQWRKSAPKGFSDKAKNQMSNFMDFVGNVNSTVELVTRVAVYKALRERGISAKQSAQIAGDITVDFNKKGEWGALISSMYMFFNAAVQGAARVFRSIKSSKKVRVMAASLFIGGFLNGIISQLWGDGDDEDYDQFIPDFKKNTRIVFADPTGKEWTVFFLPYGFGFFWAAGRSFSEVVRGKKDILESSVNVTRAFVQSFLPIDVMGGWKEFVPSSVKPLVEVATNEAWYDAPIAPDQPAYQPKIPESQRYFKTASNMSKSLSTWLNSVTGGDENRSGIVDISPEFIDYLWQQYTSGAGSFIGNVAETGYGAIKGDIKKERVPFVRSFVADVKKESVIKSNVYDIIDEGARRLFDQTKKDKFYKQVDWLIKNGSLSEDEQENIDKGNELKINFLKAQYNFTLGDKISIVEAMDKMSEKDINIFFESLTPRQIKSIRTGK